MGQILPISHPIAEALARRRARRDPDSPLVFHRDGIPVRRWRTAWRTACQATGVPTRFLHDCRRTAARNLIRASVPERVAMLLTGHKTRAIFDRHNIINEQELLEAGDQPSGQETGRRDAARQRPMNAHSTADERVVAALAHRLDPGDPSSAAKDHLPARRAAEREAASYAYAVVVAARLPQRVAFAQNLQPDRAEPAEQESDLQAPARRADPLPPRLPPHGRPQPAGPRRQAPRHVASILDAAREFGIRDAQGRTPPACAPRVAPRPHGRTGP